MKIICSQWQDAADLAAVYAGNDGSGVGVETDGPWDAAAWTPLRHTFTLPETALGRTGQPFFLPEALGEISVTLWCAARISRLGKNVSARFASRYYDGLTIGAVMQSRTLLARQQREGLPWHAAMAFDAAVWVGRWLPPTEWDAVVAGQDGPAVILQRDGETLAKLDVSVARECVDRLLAAESRWNLMRQGDLLLVGSGATEGAVGVGRDDHLCFSLGEQPLLHVRVK